VPAARYQELSSNLPAETSAQIKERVNKARTIQRERFKDEGTFHNAQMSHKQVRKFCISTVPTIIELPEANPNQLS
jgi:magnesium chelatase family protein